MVKLKILVKYEIVSKKIKNHVKKRGIFFGINILRKFNLWYIIPTKLIIKKITKII